MSNDFFVSLNFIVIKAKYTGYRLAWSTTCEFGAYDDDENLVSINPILKLPTSNKLAIL